jgi:hypothetical protein
MGELSHTYKTLSKKTEGQKLFGRPRNRWENGIQIDFKEVGCDNVDWFHLA